jgi:hypothetical protein
MGEGSVTKKEFCISEEQCLPKFFSEESEETKVEAGRRVTIYPHSRSRVVGPVPPEEMLKKVPGQGCNTPRGYYLSNFRSLQEKMLSIALAKNADYAGEDDPFANFREFGTLGFLVRMSDKWKRIRNLVGSVTGPAVKDETVEDTLLDLANYCLLLICWLRSEK